MSSGVCNRGTSPAVMLAGRYDFGEEDFDKGDYPPLTIPFVNRALDIADEGMGK